MVNTNIPQFSSGDGDGAPAKIIQVSVPAKLAYDLDSMQKVTSRVLDQLGCPACHSGFDIRFDIERRFIFDNDLNIKNL